MSSLTILYIIISGIVALLVALFQYRLKSKKQFGAYKVLTFLRFVSVFAILLLLINPKIEKENYYSEKPHLILAVDNSKSTDFLNHSTSVQQLIDDLKSNSELNDKFNLEFYTFGKTFKASDSTAFDENETNIDQAFKGLSEIYKNSIAPTLLITDGNQTYGNDYSYTSSQHKQVVFPIILGDTTIYKDLKISQFNVNKYAFVKNRFPVEAFVVYNGTEAISTRFTIINGNTTVYSEIVNFDKTNNSKVLNFTLPANQVGLFTYKATIEPLDSEINKINNIKNFALEVIDEKTTIAIVSDFLHPDLGALKKSIETNEQRSVALLSPQEYLKQQNEFQLVVLYQPNNNFKEVYQALNNSNSNRFIIAGTKTDLNFLNANSTNYTHDLTSQTENYLPIVNLNYASFIINDLDFESFPPLLSKFGDLTFNSPFETVLNKKVGNIVTDSPLLATFENNGRREAILLGEDIWKWRAQSFLNTKSFNEFDDFIGKMVQYLASSKRKDRLNLDYESFYEGNSNVIIKAQYFNKNYEFDNRETLSITVKDKLSNEVKEFPFVLKNTNFQVDLSSLPASDYSFTVKATNDDVSKSGNFKILEYNIEQQFLNADVTKLQTLATNHSGTSYFINHTENLVDNLISDTRFATIEKSTKNIVPLIDFKFLLALIALCLALEWFIRKYNGLI